MNKRIKINTGHLPIFNSLANGIDPFSGEVIPNFSKETIDFFVAVMNGLRKSDRIPFKSDEYVNSGKKWEQPEEQSLKELYVSGKSVSELTNIFSRTRGGITSRLVILGFANHHMDITEYYSGNKSDL